jgi:hypothetical protein
VFTSLTAFDQHQVTDYSRRPAVWCRPPAEAGLARGENGPLGCTAERGRGRASRIAEEDAMTEAHEKWTWQKARAANQALAQAHDGLHALYEELMRVGRARQVLAIRDGLDNARFHLRQLMVVYAKLPVDGPTAGEAAAVLAELEHDQAAHGLVADIEETLRD